MWKHIHYQRNLDYKHKIFITQNDVHFFCKENISKLTKILFRKKNIYRLEISFIQFLFFVFAQIVLVLQICFDLGLIRLLKECYAERQGISGFFVLFKQSTKTKEILYTPNKYLSFSSSSLFASKKEEEKKNNSSCVAI